MVAAVALAPEPKRGLILGHGGGSLAKWLAQVWPELELDVVEFDPVVVRMAEQYFDYRPPANHHVSVKDARVFLEAGLCRIAAERATDADLAAELALAESWLWQVGRWVDEGATDFGIEASLLKMRASDLAMRASTDSATSGSRVPLRMWSTLRAPVSTSVQRASTASTSLSS